MFKPLNGLAPVYLNELFSERHTDYDLSYSGALLWNSLPESIRAIRLIGKFKKEISRALETFDSHSAIL